MCHLCEKFDLDCVFLKKLECFSSEKILEKKFDLAKKASALRRLLNYQRAQVK
jgi:hypothetical protein